MTLKQRLIEAKAQAYLLEVIINAMITEGETIPVTADILDNMPGYFANNVLLEVLEGGDLTRVGKPLGSLATMILGTVSETLFATSQSLTIELIDQVLEQLDVKNIME